jgi:hypothetical protein
MRSPGAAGKTEPVKLSVYLHTTAICTQRNVLYQSQWGLGGPNFRPLLLLKKIVSTRFLNPDSLSQNPGSLPGTISICDRLHRSMQFRNPEPCDIHVVMKFATAARGTTPVVYRVNESKLPSLTLHLFIFYTSRPSSNCSSSLWFYRWSVVVVVVLLVVVGPAVPTTTNSTATTTLQR